MNVKFSQVRNYVQKLKNNYSPNKERVRGNTLEVSKFCTLIISVSLIMLASTSCAFKDEGVEESGLAKSSQSLSLDSDLDGISDGEEINNGTDPFVADLPEISISKFIDMKLSARLESTDKDNTVLYSFSDKNLNPLKLENSVNKAIHKTHFAFLTTGLFDSIFDDYRYVDNLTIPLSDRYEYELNRDLLDFAQNSASVEIQFHPIFNNMVSVEKISNIKFDVVTYDNANDSFDTALEELKDLDKNGSPKIYNSENGFFSSKSSSHSIRRLLPINTIDNLMNSNYELTTRITDYTLVRNGTKFSYNDLLQSFEQNLSKLVIVTPSFKKEVFVTPNKSFRFYLNRMSGSSYIDENENIISAFGHLSNLNINSTDISKINQSDLLKGRWSFLNDDGGVDSPLEAGQTYYLVYSRLNQLIVSKATPINPSGEAEIDLSSEFNLGNKLHGDTAVFVVEPLLYRSIAVRGTQGASYNYMFAQPCPGVPEFNCDESGTIACSVDYDHVRTSELPDENFNYTLDEFDISITDGEKTVRLNDLDDFKNYGFSLDGKKFKFSIELNDLDLDLSKVKLVSNKKIKTQVDYGFAGYGNCNTNAPYFGLNMSTSRHNITKEDEIFFKGSVIINGFPR